MHIYLGDLKNDTPSWDFIQSVKKGKDAYCTGKNEFLNFGKFKPLDVAKKQTYSEDVILYGDIASLTPSQITNLLTAPFISLRIISLSQYNKVLFEVSKLKELLVLPEIEAQFEEQNIAVTRKTNVIKTPIQYTPDFMGPATTSMDKGILLIGLNAENYADLFPKILDLAELNDTKTMEFFIHKPDVTVIQSAEITRKIRVTTNLQITLVNIMDHKYSADKWTNTFLVYDLLKLSQHEHAANQYRALYETEVTNMQGTVNRMWKYANFKRDSIRKQSQAFYGEE